MQTLRNRSRWAVPLLLLILVALIGGCSEKRHANRIVFAAALLPSEQSEYTDILRSFTRKTGIQVELVAQQYDQIRMSLEAEAQARRGQLDLVELDVYMLPLLQKKMRPLDSLLTFSDSLRIRVPKDAWQAGVLGSPAHLSFVPHRLNWEALIYNARLLGSPPRTWDALLRVAKAHPGAVGLKAARYEGLVCDLFPFVWQAGGDVLHPNTPQVLAAVQFLRKLAPYLNPFVRSYKENNILQAQEQEEIVLHPNWPFAVPLLRQKGLLPETMRTAPLPSGPAGPATVLGGGYLGVPRTAPHPKRAAKLLRFLTGRFAQRAFVRRLGWFPIREDAWSAMTQKDQRDFSGFLAMRRYVRARPSLLSYPEISRIWQNGFYRMIFGKQDPGRILPQMQRQIDALVTKGKP